MHLRVTKELPLIDRLERGFLLPFESNIRPCSFLEEYSYMGYTHAVLHENPYFQASF